MLRIRKKLAYLFALLLFVVVFPVKAEYTLLHGPLTNDAMGAHIYELDNGLRVYLTQNSEEPRFYSEIVVRAGSKHDPPEATGIAHYLEHMLFKGTKRLGTLDFESEQGHLDRIKALYEEHFYTTNEEQRIEIYKLINLENQSAAKYAVPNELDRIYNSIGARSLNAHTSVEETVYKVDLPIDRLEQWAHIEAERFREPIFRLFQTEIETVYEEKNRSMDNKGRVIRQLVNKSLYLKHPYKNSVLGSIDHLKNPSLSHMHSYLDTYYVPNNMAIIISGDIDVDKTIDLIDRQFSVWQKRDLPKAPIWEEPTIDTVRRIEVDYPGEDYVLIAFRTVSNKHRDAEALQMLDMILDNATAGLINLNLNQRQLVREAGSYPYLNNDYGAQYLWAIPKDGQTHEDLEQLLIDQVRQIQEGNFDEWILPAITTDFTLNYKQGLENNATRVAMMRKAFVAHKEWENQVGHLSRLEMVSKEDVMRVAKKYFKNAYVAGYRRDGKANHAQIQKPPIDDIEIDPSRESEFAQQILKMPFEQPEPHYISSGNDFSQTLLRDGLTLYHTKNPLNDLFAFEINIKTGSLLEPKLPLARLLLDKSATPSFSAEEIKIEWYKLGTSLGINVGDQEVTISISGPSKSLSASLDLLIQIMRTPEIEQETLKELKQIVVTRREDAMKDHNTVHRALYHYNRLNDNAYFRRIPTNSEIMGFTKKDLIGVITDLLNYQQTLSYTGPLSEKEVAAVISEHYPLPQQLNKTPDYQHLSYRKPDETEIFFVHREMAQSLVRVEFGDVPYNQALEPAIELYNDYYGGMAGILFQEIREARALAYSVGARYVNGEQKGDYNLMLAAVGTQADKTVEALGALVGLIDDLPVSQDRFTSAKGSLENNYRTERIGFRSILSSVQNWERKGLATDPRAMRFEKIKESTVEDLVDFHKKHIAKRPKLISIVGDRSKIDMDELSKYGTITELNVDDLFNF